MEEIYKLDWIKIMKNAIEGRPTSWNNKPITEWRNASDEVLIALMNQAKDKGIFPDRLKELQEDKNEIRN